MTKYRLYHHLSHFWDLFRRDHKSYYPESLYHLDHHFHYNQDMDHHFVDDCDQTSHHLIETDLVLVHLEIDLVIVLVLDHLKIDLALDLVLDHLEIVIVLLFVIGLASGLYHHKIGTYRFYTAFYRVLLSYHEATRKLLRK